MRTKSKLSAQSPKPNNYAFIDGQNVNLAIRDLGWKLDFKRFRVYLKEKYNVEKAYYFIGYVEGNEILYQSLQEYGYICIFKPTLAGPDGKIKGNCDAELVLHTMIEYPNYNQAVIASGDGDFACLVEYLIEKDKLRTVLAPNFKKSSWLLRRVAQDRYIAFMNNLRQKLELKDKKKKKVP
ncbi:MAG: NYN domain-containing protein [bacterium]